MRDPTTLNNSELVHRDGMEISIHGFEMQIWFARDSEGSDGRAQERQAAVQCLELISHWAMDRSSEFSRVVEIFGPAGPSEAAAENGGHMKPPPSPFLAMAIRVNSNLEGNKVLIDKMSVLADRKEFSNDPTSEIGEISEVFNSKAQQVQRDLAVMKKNPGGAYGFGGSICRGPQQQQHFKLILESLNKQQSTLLTSFQSSMKKHASNVEMRNKRVGKYGAAASITVSSIESGSSTGGGGSAGKGKTQVWGEDSKETYAMFANTGPSLRQSPPRITQQQRRVQTSTSLGRAALPQAGSLHKQASAPALIPPVSAPSTVPPGSKSAALPPPMNSHQIQNHDLYSQCLPSPSYTSSAPGPPLPPPPPAPAPAPAQVTFSHPGAVATAKPGPIPEVPVNHFSIDHADDGYRPGSTYTSRRRPRASGPTSTGVGAFQDQYNQGYGDGTYEGGDKYENPKMAQQKRDRSRLKGAEKVEAALAQMGSLFSQVATMVVEQGEVLTRIEDDVENGLEEVKLGHQQMERFWEISKQGRGVIFTLIVITVVFVVFFLYIR